MERLSLARERIEQYETEGVHLSEEMSLFFEKEIHFASMVISEWDSVAAGKLQTAPVMELRQRNEAHVAPCEFDRLGNLFRRDIADVRLLQHGDRMRRCW